MRSRVILCGLSVLISASTSLAVTEMSLQSGGAVSIDPSVQTTFVLDVVLGSDQVITLAEGKLTDSTYTGPTYFTLTAAYLPISPPLPPQLPPILPVLPDPLDPSAEPVGVMNDVFANGTLFQLEVELDANTPNGDYWITLTDVSVADLEYNAIPGVIVTPVQVTVTPEPGAALMLLLGVAVMTLRRRS